MNLLTAVLALPLAGFLIALLIPRSSPQASRLWAFAVSLVTFVASLGLAVAFYYGITAFSCVWYFRKTLFSSTRNLFFRGIFPLLGGIAMAWAFGWSAKDMIAADYGYTAFGPIGGVFVLGVGMLVLGIPQMLACFAFGTKRFFRGETLNANTEVKVPDVS